MDDIAAIEQFDTVTQLLCELVHAEIEAQKAEEAGEFALAQTAREEVDRLMGEVRYAQMPREAADWADAYLACARDHGARR